MDAMAKLKQARFCPVGTVTAGNASSLNDGAALLVLCTEEYAKANDLQPLAEIVSYAAVGVDPALMGLGPASAVPKALQRAGMKVEDIDLFELNEAFASQSIAVIRDLGLNPAKVNHSGGGDRAGGTPLARPGRGWWLRCCTALRTEGKRYGVASLCIGGGMGIAMVLRNPAA